MTRLRSAAPVDGGASVEVRWSDDRTSRFHAFRPRDDALDAGTRSPGNRQRLVTLGDIPRDLRVAEVDVADDAVSVRFAPEGLLARFPAYRLHGCYADEDGLLSTLSVLEGRSRDRAA